MRKKLLWTGVIILVFFLSFKYLSFHLGNIDYFLNDALFLSEESKYIVNLGYLGGFFAGTFGIVLSFLSVLFLAFTLINQIRSNEISEIENRIFKLLDLLVEIKNQNNLSKKSSKFLKSNKDKFDLGNLKRDLKNNHLYFSNFFRMLYQTLKYIDENERKIHNGFYTKSLKKDVKNYTNIVRSYLDTDLLTCLAINCYCLPEEKDEYSYYKYLLERYSFLEHLPNTLPMQFSSYLYYEKKAFGKSTWFSGFETLRSDFFEISKTKNISNFSEIFLYFMSKNNGEWKNENISLKVTENNKKIIILLSSLNFIEGGVFFPICFNVEKSDEFNSMKITCSNYPSLSSNHEVKIFKNGEKIEITYFQPEKTGLYASLVKITFMLIDRNSLEIDFSINPEKVNLALDYLE